MPNSSGSPVRVTPASSSSSRARAASAVSMRSTPPPGKVPAGLIGMADEQDAASASITARLRAERQPARQAPVALQQLPDDAVTGQVAAPCCAASWSGARVSGRHAPFGRARFARLTVPEVPLTPIHNPEPHDERNHHACPRVGCASFADCRELRCVISTSSAASATSTGSVSAAVRTRARRSISSSPTCWRTSPIISRSPAISSTWGCPPSTRRRPHGCTRSARRIT